MTTSLSSQDFLRVVRQSGLVTEPTLSHVVEEAQQQDQDLTTASAIAEILVGQHVLTPWQCQKMMEGRHRGFFLGKYRLLSLLGKGGMSSVYLAEHMVMHRQCAIKVLPSNRVDDASYLARFEREAQAVAALDHPNIVRAYDVDYQQSGKQRIHYLVMEYVNGRELNTIVKSGGPIGFKLAADLMRQSADGLAHAHQAGLVHRDIKPSNLLVDTAGTVKILDLGLARMYTDSESYSVTVDNEQKVLGTIDYLAPEQALNSHEVDARADIYGLGCTFYFLLAGHAPFTEGTIAQRIMAHQTIEPPALNTLRSDIPPRLQQLVQRMMAKRLEERYQTANNVSADLAVWLSQQGDRPASTVSDTFPNLAFDDSPAVEFPSDLSFVGQAESPLEPKAVVEFLANLSASGELSNVKSDAEPARATSPPVAPALPDGVDSEITIAVPSWPSTNNSDATSQQQSADTIVAHPVPMPDAPPPIQPMASPAASIEGSSQSPPDISQLIITQPDEPGPDYRRRRSGDRKRTMIAGIVGLATVIAFFGLFRLWSGDRSVNDPTSKDSIRLKPTMIVGENGDFESITAAIAFVKENFIDTKWDEQTIQVSAGTYRERIQITHTALKPFPIGVRLATKGPVILDPEGPEPIIQIQDVQGLIV
ncbi:MAG: protein kinase, partial [Planctomycetaceae bacterium]